MRVALVIAGPFPAFRGSQVLVGHLADGLRSRGHMVDLVTYGSWLADCPGPGARRVAVDVALTARLVARIRRERIDVVHAHNYEAAIAGLVAARLTGRPLVYHGHCAMGDELPTYFASPWLRTLAARVGHALDVHVPRRADFCIAVTEEQIGYLSLPTRPTKASDSRSKTFGASSVELDAINPEDLRSFVRYVIEFHLPRGQLDIQVRRASARF